MTKVILRLTPQGIDAAIREIKRNRLEVDKKVQELISVMVAEGEDYAINTVGHVDTGETLASIHGYREGNKGVIVAGGAAIWLEFGTGVIRNSERHPKADELGMKAWGEYGKGHGKDPNGWYYPDGEGWSHTYGIEANMFMYHTAQYLKQIFTEKAREVFK